MADFFQPDDHSSNTVAEAIDRLRNELAYTNYMLSHIEENGIDVYAIKHNEDKKGDK